MGEQLDISVIVPVRNAEGMIDECLASIAKANPREIIVVDGNSTDKTLEIAERYPVKILSDEGRGLPWARTLGARTAESDTVALIDVDIVLADGDLEALYDEFKSGGYAALQFGLNSVAGPGYWGQALVDHHRKGRSKKWPGVMATLFKKDVLLTYGFDGRFTSGEDIEIRWRLRSGGEHIGVSEKTIVDHRYEDSFGFAKDQFLADGKGLARMVGKYKWRALPILGIPLAGCIRGIWVNLRERELKWIPYFLTYLVYNYIGILQGFWIWRKQASEPEKL